MILYYFQYENYTIFIISAAKVIIFDETTMAGLGV